MIVKLMLAQPGVVLEALATGLEDVLSFGLACPFCGCERLDVRGVDPQDTSHGCTAKAYAVCCGGHVGLIEVAWSFFGRDEDDRVFQRCRVYSEEALP